MADDKFSRRSLFKLGGSQRKEKLIAFSKDVLGNKILRTHLRPPGALPEDKFLAKCTKCELCVDACPHESLFLLPEDDEEGLSSKTPTFDMYETPCYYCEDMPCISACEPKALIKVEEEPIAKIGTAVFKIEHCLVEQGQYCDYCFRNCPAEHKALTMNDKKMPEIDPDICVGCGKCAYYCVSQSGKAIEIVPLDQ